MEILEKIKKELEEFDKKRKGLVEELRKQFPLMFLPLFEKTEVIESIGWTQYTPYFNDGDTCEFSVHHSYLLINDEDEYSDDFSEHERKLIKDFKDVLQSIPEDFYKDLFGDHSKVTIYKDGRMEVDEYEHD
jgi:hypothetical protein